MSEEVSNIRNIASTEINNFKLPGGSLKEKLVEGNDLFHNKKEINQEIMDFILPQGGLKNKYQPHHEEFESIQASIINKYDKISFKTIGSKKYPILLTDGQQYHCLYGWSFVESTVAAEDHTIRCLVKYVETLSALSLSINAAALWIKSECDPIQYPEIILTFKTIMEEYEDAGIDISHVEHGGARRGETLKTLKQDDFIDNELVGALGKSRKTILTYMSDSSHLAEDLFDHLIAHKASKDFFEKIRNKKNEAIRLIEGEMKDDDFDFSEYTTKIISDNIRNALIEYKLGNPIPQFILHTQTEFEDIKDAVKSVMLQFEKAIEEENEKKRLDSLNSEEEKDEEVKFPNFEDDQPDNKENEILIADIKILHEELGKLIADTTATNFKNEALAICTKLLKRLTA